MSLPRAARLVVTAAAILGACSVGPDTLRVTSVQVGKSLNSDDTIGNQTTTFRPDDTMYASVLTEGRGTATIVVKWSYAGQVVSESERRVSYNDRAATEFHLQRPGGFPPGSYEVAISFNGEPLDTRALRVEK